jgi:hypothetical protein
MMAHELLRQAALILAAGWSKGSDARHVTGRIVPLHVGDTRAKINPEAAAFSPYGAVSTEDDQLRQLIAKKTSITVITAKLKRSSEAVRMRMFKLRISGKARPAGMRQA